MENEEKDYLEVLTKALKNANHDRSTISAIATNCLKYVSQSPERHGTVGIVLAKYLDLMQKSNEQLIKIAQNLPRDTDDNDLDIDDVLEEIKEIHEK
jgi:hypothetical protein